MAILEKNIVKIICQHFSNKGYSCNKNFVLHRGNIKFVPDLVCEKDGERIIFTTKSGKVLRRNEVEQIGLYARFFTYDKFYICVPFYTKMGYGSKKLLSQLGIGLIKVKDDDLKFKLKARSYINFAEWLNQLQQKINLKSKQAWLVEDHLNTFYIFRSTLNTISRYDQILETYSKRIKLRIPQELLDYVSELKKVHYAKDLTEFERKYRNVTSHEEEYKLILKTLEKLWTNYRKERGARLFESFKEFEPLLKREPWYRDHMVHPFQVFLMGSIIIDKFYEKFLESYKRKLSNASDEDLDFAWLLCSTFHDFCYPIQMFDTLNRALFKKFLQTEAELPIYLQTERILFEGEQLKLIDQLVSLYTHYGENPERTSWIFDDKCVIDNQIRSLLLKHIIKNRNHAPLSALALLNTISKEEIAQMSYNYRQTTFSTAVYPAALAIALHDNSILQELPERCKISFENMPLQFLLIYCDIAQEFGRTDTNESCFLKNFDLETNLIDVKLVFTDEKKHKSKCEEVEKAFKRITSNLLEFKLTLIYNGIEHSVTTKGSRF